MKETKSVPVFLIFACSTEDCDVVFCDLDEETAKTHLEKIESEPKPFGVSSYKLRVAMTGISLKWDSMMTLEEYHNKTKTVPAEPTQKGETLCFTGAN